METNFNWNIGPRIWQILSVLAILFLALLILDKVYTVWQDFSPTVPKNTIAVSAEGQVSGTPDLATVDIGVIANDTTATQVQNDISQKANQITAFVKQQGIVAADITTSNFSINPSYNYTNGTSTINGYQGSESITVKIHGVDKSTDTIGKILDGAVANGSNQIQGINFSFNDPDNLQQQARLLAIANAKQKAQALADAAGLKLGRVVTIADNSVGTPGPIPLPYAVGGVANSKSIAPTIETGSQNVTADITVTYELK